MNSDTKIKELNEELNEWEELVLMALISDYIDNHVTKIPRTLTLTGELWVQDILTGNPLRCQEQFRMPVSTFEALEEWAYQHTEIRDSRNHQGISAREKLAIFLWTAGHGASNRDAQKQFQHSGDTISRCFHEGLQACFQLHKYVVHQPSSSTPCHPRIANNTKYKEYFKDCVGALDGTHFAAWVPESQAPPYRNRKGWLSQNVLAICDFGLEFTYILAGWEGCAHDSRVLEDAITNGGMQVPHGKYLLADAGYYDTDVALTPYPGVRYHLKEQAAANRKPGNKEELFNLRHSSLRNAIEQIFGVYKRRFQCFDSAPKFSILIQIRMVFALTAVHNWIRRHSVEEDMYERQERLGEDEREVRMEQPDPVTVMTRGASSKMDQMREKLASDMWDDYVKQTKRE